MGNLRAEVQRPGVRKGAWSEEEDRLPGNCIEKYGEGKWSHVPERAGKRLLIGSEVFYHSRAYHAFVGLKASKGAEKSCRLRWLNHLCPRINREKFSEEETDLIIRLHKLLGNRWSLIAGRLPGRTANDIKNYWNSHLSKKIEVENKKAEPSADAKVIKPRPWTVPLHWTWSGDQQEEFGVPELLTISEKDEAWLKSIIDGDGENNSMLNVGNVNTTNLQKGFGIRELEENRDGALSLKGVLGWDDLLWATISSS